MSHDASKVLLGQVGSNIKEVVNKAGDPATFLAGLCVHLKSDDTLSLASADGSKLGISLGASLSDTKRVPIATKGMKVPILLTASFTPTVGAQVQISTTTGKAVSSGTAVNAYYASGKLTAIKEDGTEDSTDGCALINMPGGL